jgi:hypothetical protein
MQDMALQRVYIFQERSQPRASGDSSVDGLRLGVAIRRSLRKCHRAISDANSSNVSFIPLKNYGNMALTLYTTAGSSQLSRHALARASAAACTLSFFLTHFDRSNTIHF